MASLKWIENLLECGTVRRYVADEVSIDARIALARQEIAELRVSRKQLHKDAERTVSRNWTRVEIAAAKAAARAEIAAAKAAARS